MILWTSVGKSSYRYYSPYILPLWYSLITGMRISVLKHPCDGWTSDRNFVDDMIKTHGPGCLKIQGSEQRDTLSAERVGAKRDNSFMGGAKRSNSISVRETRVWLKDIRHYWENPLDPIICCTTPELQSASCPTLSPSTHCTRNIKNTR